jgi:DNA transposition AAA+ family ATPase
VSRSCAGLLREAGYSFQANSKTLQGRHHPDRDAQFRYLADQAEAHLADGQPVVNGLFRVKRATCFSQLRPAGIGGYSSSVYGGVG